MTALPTFLLEPTAIPLPRLEPHRRALAIVEAHERDGAPFALLLQTYSVMQMFTASDTELGDHFENLLANRLPVGVGLVEVQPHDGFGELMFDGVASGASRLPVYAPSLFLADDTWLKAVTYLIKRAELIVVLLQVNSSGVVRELEAVVANGRVDRTVVLFPEVWLQPIPILDQFPRVLSVADLDPRDILSTFIFEDLIKRLLQIRDDRSTPLPVSGAGLNRAFEALAARTRGEGRSTAAARYFANAARLALLEGDTAAAVRLTAARVDLLPQDQAQLAVASLSASIGEAAGDDPSLQLAHTQLVILHAQTLTDADEAIRLLDEEYARCQGSPNRRALSALRTARAWKLREKGDAEGVLQAGHEALALAQAAGAGLELVHALLIVGTTWHELGDFSKAGRTLQQALDSLPPERSAEDLFMILIRLGLVMRDAGHPLEARAVLDLAVNTAVAGSLAPAEANVARERLAQLESHGTDSS